MTKLEDLQNHLAKATGVAERPGPPPGPPPREGLEWKPDSHRWIRPEDKPVEPASKELVFEMKMLKNAERLAQYYSDSEKWEWDNRAKGYGVTVEELRKARTEKLQEIVDKCSVWIRMPSARLLRVFDDGRFKNISETKEMSPGKVGSLPYYLRTRRRSEEFLFDLKPADPRPIYGYASDSDVGNVATYHSKPDSDWLSGYGDCRVKLKDSVKDRATFTLEDSLDINDADAKQVRVIPYPIKKLGPEASLCFTWDHTKAKNMDDIQNMYSEVQIHDGVKLEDIESIVFEDTPGLVQSMKPSESGWELREDIAKKLKDLGISYSIKRSKQ